MAQQKQQSKYKINKQITATELRVVTIPDGFSPGIYSYREAVEIAKQFDFDIIQISDDYTTPAVCKIMELSKFNYDIKQREKAMKKGQVGGKIKEIQLGWDIAENDLKIKAKKTEEFLCEGNKVKVIIQFRGRENLYKEKGEVVMLKFAEMLAEYGTPEFMPKIEGKQCLFIIKPVAKK